MTSQAISTTPQKRFNSRSEVFAIFVACSFPIFVWAIPLTLAYVSQWLLRLTLVETLSVVAYILAFVLIESLIVFAVVMLLHLILPRRLLGSIRLPLTAVFVFLTTAFVIFLNITQEKAINRGNLLGTLGGLAVYVLLVGLAYVLLRRSPRFARIVSGIIDRLVPLTMLYAGLGVLGLIAVIVRFFVA